MRSNVKQASLASFGFYLSWAPYDHDSLADTWAMHPKLSGVRLQKFYEMEQEPMGPFWDRRPLCPMSSTCLLFVEKL